MFKSTWSKIVTVLLLTYVVTIAWFAYQQFVNNIRVYDEAGLLENLQAGLLAIACITYLFSVKHVETNKKLILISCALLCYSFIVRELDVETLNVPKIVVLLGSGIGRNISLAIAFLSILIYTIWDGFPKHFRAGLQFAGTLSGLLLISAGALLYLAEFFEDLKSLYRNRFYEEAIELLAYLLIVFSALSSSNVLRKKPSPQSDLDN